MQPLPVIETYKTTVGTEVKITRNNTLIDGYRPVIRELQGIVNITLGINNLIFSKVASFTNQESGLRGRAQIKDGLINVACSPITTLGIGYLLGRTLSC